MDKVELRRRRIINIIYFAIVLGLAYFLLKYCLWMLFPFILAFFIAVIVQRPSDFISRKTKLKKGLSSTLVVLLMFAAIGLFISLLGMKLVDSGKDFVDFITRKLSDFPTLIDNVKNWVISSASILPDAIESKFVESVSGWFDVMREKSASEIAEIIMDGAQNSGGGLSILSTPLNGIWSTAKHIPSVFLAVVVSILSSCFMASDYDWIVGFIKKQFPEEHRHKLSKSKHIVVSSVGKLIRSYALIICITGSEIFLGLNILKLTGLYTNGHIFAISLAVALIDIIPVLGTGTVMIPWAIYSLITHKTGLAIGLFILYAIIYIIRQIIEPKIVGGTVGLPSFVALMAMYIGSQLFGFIGIFLMPILIIIVKLLNDEGIIHFWEKYDYEENKKKKPKGNKIIDKIRKKS